MNRPITHARRGIEIAWFASAWDAPIRRRPRPARHWQKRRVEEFDARFPREAAWRLRPATAPACGCVRPNGMSPSVAVSLRSGHRAFTLIEMLVVIAIIGILAGIL